eukprot:Anaeramoba_ignava/a483548_23.p1 GENE.a483548_23~~a483548_23.p1  ORF type:complete len:186 (-),score=9.13 a483548_23:1022-1579(-)
MKKMKKIILNATGILAASVILTGCGIKTNEYNVSADNVMQLKKMENTKIAVDSFDSANPGESSKLCRLAETISTPQGEPFEKYIENALKSELKMADMYDENSNLKISGKVLKVDASTMLGNAYWAIELTVKSNNGKTIQVNTKREYPSAYLAMTACNNMATSFSPTVRNLVSDIINHKEFKTLLN